MKKVEIDSIAELGSSAFYSCDGLELVVIESSIIGRYAFEYCANLSNVVLGAGVSDIGDSAFCRCGSLREISIPVNVTNIGRSAFECCSNLRTMVIPENVRMIGSYAFENCKALSCIEIFGGELGSSLFYGCDALEEVYIGSGVSKIAYGAFSGCYTLKTVYVGYGDVGRVKGLCEWPSKVEFVEIVPPSVDGDADATVTGGPVGGFVIRPSVEKTAVEVTIPQGMDAAKVTVEVSPKVASVKPNGAKVKIVSGGADITEFLNVPVADGDGVIELTKATVKEEIVKEAMDAEKGAKIVLDAANPSLTTPNTRVGLFYQLREGVSIEGMANGDSTIGDGNPWSPEIKVKGGNSAFYSIGVGKGE